MGNGSTSSPTAATGQRLTIETHSAVPTIRFYFDYISPNAYPAWTQLPRLAERLKLIDALFQAVWVDCLHVSDPVVVEDGHDLARASPAGTTRLERFAGCGHPVSVDDVERCFATIREFPK